MGQWANAEAVSPDRWEQLINSVLDQGRINDQPYTGRVDARIVTLLCYRNVILNRLGPGNPTVAIHVDHIVPRTQFETETNDAVKANMHHIANLALLPQKENQQKSGRLLDQITDRYLRDSIAKYEDVPIEDFPRFATSASSVDLRELRGAILRSDFTERRVAMFQSYT